MRNPPGDAVGMCQRYNAIHPDDPLTIGQFVGAEIALMRKLRQAFIREGSDIAYGEKTWRIKDIPTPKPMGRKPRAK